MKVAEDSITSPINQALNSLGEEGVTDDEKLQLLEEVYEFITSRQYTYDDKIVFDSDDDVLKDYALSRKVFLDSLDKTKVMSDIILQMLAGSPQNILLMETLQENIKLAQASSKALIDLHNNFAKKHHQILRNKKLSKEVKDDEEGEEGEDSKIQKLLKEQGILFK